MLNLVKKAIETIPLVISIFIFCSGCASSFSTLRTSDPALKARYYDASYDKVMNAVVEAASKTRNWKVRDVDESQGIVTAVDSDIWRSYIVKISVVRTKDQKVRVDALCYTSADIVAANKEFIAEFLNRLDEILSKN